MKHKTKVILFIGIIIMTIIAGVGTYHLVLHIENRGVPNKIYEDRDYIFTADREVFNWGEDDWASTSVVERPFINLDSEAINELNNRLEALFDDSVSTNETSTDEEGHRWWRFSGLEYTWFNNDNILSLVITRQDGATGGGGWLPTHEVHNINRRTGELLTSRELIDLKFTSTTEFQTNINRAIDNYFENQREWSEFRAGDLATTKQNLNLDDLLIYINRRGNVSVIITAEWSDSYHGVGIVTLELN